MDLTDEDGSISASYDQDAFGNVLSGSASGYHLTTKDFNANIGLYYFFYRWYDPQIGRFLIKAPLPIYIEHPYSYVNNNPINKIDPSGKFWKEACLVTCAIGCEAGCMALIKVWWICAAICAITCDKFCNPPPPYPIDGGINPWDDPCYDPEYFPPDNPVAKLCKFEPEPPISPGPPTPSPSPLPTPPPQPQTK